MKKRDKRLQLRKVTKRKEKQSFILHFSAVSRRTSGTKEEKRCRTTKSRKTEKTRVKKNAIRKTLSFESFCRELARFKESQWLSFDEFEKQLDDLEKNHFEKSNVDEEKPVENSEDEEDEDFYCVACNKSFKSDKAFVENEKRLINKTNSFLLVLLITKILENTKNCFS